MIVILEFKNVGFYLVLVFSCSIGLGIGIFLLCSTRYCYFPATVGLDVVLVLS